jgi:Fe-S cluster biogenesis protein NfuA
MQPRVSKDGTQIRKRGFADVVNRFGGNCFGCHAAARPESDLICEDTHGCAPIPLTRAMSGALQRSDPRCSCASAGCGS